MYIINKTQLHTPTDCFTLWRNHQGDLNQHNKTITDLKHCKEFLGGRRLRWVRKKLL